MSYRGMNAAKENVKNWKRNVKITGKTNKLILPIKKK